MKRGSEYAKRIKRLYHELLRKYGRPGPREPADPIDQLVVGILALDCSLTKAQTVYKKLRQNTVDLNELRVTPAIELAQMIGDTVPLAAAKAQRIVDALNAVRRRQDTLDLSFLRQRGRREAREYLESLDGVGPTVAAHVVLFSLGGHAIPVDNLTLYVLRKEELIDGSADIAVVQGFLEHWVSASDGANFVQLLSRHVAAVASRVAVDELPKLLSPEPPAPAVEAPPETAPVPAEPPAPAKTKAAGHDGRAKKPAAPAKAKTKAKAARTRVARPAGSSRPSSPRKKK
jgi:endonuclease III